jgi:hypothetical protein
MSFTADDRVQAVLRHESLSRDRVRILRWWLADHWRKSHYLAGIIWC